MAGRRNYLPSFSISNIQGSNAALLALALGLVSAAALASAPTATAQQGRSAQVETVSLSNADIAQLETRMWQMLNRDRTSPSVADETKGHAHPLQWDARLAALARGHSEEMAETGTFSHREIDGSLPMTRVSQAGIQWLALGENIAKSDDLTQAEQAFMDEPKFKPNHRGNILNPDYNHVGIGIARAPDGSLYITQEFAELP
jgi:uncharacterized protein YkwD